ncbi:MAG: hypothetical protein U1A27_13610 [Phycisphaerae bacterium]
MNISSNRNHCTESPSGAAHVRVGRDRSRRRTGLVRRAAHVVGALTALGAIAVQAQPAGFAPCPGQVTATSMPTPRTVVVQVLEVRALQRFDPTILGVSNDADFFGDVTIDGHRFNLPIKEGRNDAFWDKRGGAEGTFAQDVSGNSVSIQVHIREDDQLGTGADNEADISPASGRTRLNLVFNLCSMRVSGDVPEQGAQDVIVAEGNGDAGRARIRLRVGLDEGRPPTTDDVALVNADLVQVVHDASRLIADKPTVVMVRVANNFSTPEDLPVRVVATEDGRVIRDETRMVRVGGHAVQREYLFADNPLRFSGKDPPEINPLNFLPPPSVVEVTVTVDPSRALESGLPALDCRRLNNTTTLRRKCFRTRPLELMWGRAGTALDIGFFVPHDRFKLTQRLGHGFISATYPIAPDNLTSDTASFDILPPATAVLDVLHAVAGLTGLPADAIQPFIMVYEMNIIAGIAGNDRLMGVLPTGFFNRYSYDLWADTIGLSLGEFAPRAVIFEPDGQSIMPPPPFEDDIDGATLAAHELGHTFGLSVDEDLKNIFCNVSLPEIFNGTGYANPAILLCGALGGFDEYKLDDPDRALGLPAHGFWVAQGVEPPELAMLPGNELCDAHCLMGNGSMNRRAGAVPTGVQWIDLADYEQLLDKFTESIDPELMLVSGVVTFDNRAQFSPFYRIGTGVADIVPDANRLKESTYSLRFVRLEGALSEYDPHRVERVISEIPLPLIPQTADARQIMPFAFFSLKVPVPDGRTDLIQLWNQITNTKLAERAVTAAAPSIRISRPVDEQSVARGQPLNVYFDAADSDSRDVTYSLFVRGNGNSGWQVVVHGLEQEVSAGVIVPKSVAIPTRDLTPGWYEYQIIATDGVNTDRKQRYFQVLDCEAGPTADDADSDGVPDACDNCPTFVNPAQADLNHNGVGDACEGRSWSIPCGGGATPASAVTALSLVGMARRRRRRRQRSV